jgi:hypothetical protein
MFPHQVPVSCCLKLSCHDLAVVGHLVLSESISAMPSVAQVQPVSKVPRVVVDTATPWKPTKLSDKAECITINASAAYKHYSLAEMRWSHLSKTRRPKEPTFVPPGPVTASDLFATPANVFALDENTIGVGLWGHGTSRIANRFWLVLL